MKLILDKVENCLLAGRTRNEIHNILIAEHGLRSYNTRHKYIQKAYKTMFGRRLTDKTQLQNMFTDRLEDIVQKAIENKDINGAVNAIKVMVNISGLEHNAVELKTKTDEFSVKWSDD